MRVLVVDDEFLVALLVASMLEDLGCEVEMAHDGTEALAKLNRDARIEALITDVNMPGSRDTTWLGAPGIRDLD